MAKIFTTHKATCKLYCFKAVYNARTHFGKRGKKKDCTVHYIPNSKKWYSFLLFDCPHVQVYISQYGFMFIHFQLVQKQTFQVLLVILEFILLFHYWGSRHSWGLKGLLDGSGSARNEKRRIKKVKTQKNPMSFLHSFTPSASSVLRPCEG